MFSKDPPIVGRSMKEEERFLEYLFCKIFWGGNMEQKMLISVMYRPETNLKTYVCKHHLRLLKKKIKKSIFVVYLVIIS